MIVRRLFIFLLIGYIFSSCAGQPVVSAQAKYTLVPESPRPGEPMTVAINFVADNAQLIVNDRQVAKAGFFVVPAERRTPSFMVAILTIPSTVAPGEAIIRLNNESGIMEEIPFTIGHREFRSETIRLTPSLQTLLTTPSAERTAQAERLWAILGTTGDQIYHSGPFVLPIKTTRRTSQFGTRRVNQYPDGRRTTEIHAGVDFGAPTGTEVYACGRGLVVLSYNRIITGNTIIIEHAPGVYSLYYHLDSLIAQEDTIVEAGDLIGLVGSTGFSTGPHLHWEVRVSGENTDPDIFVSRPLIDKDLIISNIFSRR